MILISHRGNLYGKKDKEENNPNYILTTLNLGFDVEIDLWYINNDLFLGHDFPQYIIDFNFLSDHKSKLWIHCKNTQSICFLSEIKSDLNFFWHETDTLTITSKGYLWVYPGKQPIKNSISVLPEINNDDFSESLGICSDIIKNYE